jgi:hypothetical protein
VAERAGARIAPLIGKRSPHLPLSPEHFGGGAPMVAPKLNELWKGQYDL